MFSIIIADDEPFVLELLAGLIDWEEYGFKLNATFSNGNDVIKYVGENKPDLVLCDIKMPKGTGLDVARYCHENSPETLVVFLTGYRDFEYAQKAIQYGVKEYIVKPVLPDTLTDVLNKSRERLIQMQRRNLSDFPSDSNLINAQRLFSTLLSGMIEGEEELVAHFSRAEIEPSIVENPCVILNIHILNYDEYIKNIWKHEPDRLYSAISSLIYHAGEKYNFSVIRHSYINIEIIGYSLSAEDDGFKNANEAIEVIKSALLNELQLEHEITSVTYYEQLKNMIRMKPESEIEMFANDNEVINKVHAFIKNNFHKPVSARDAAEYVHLSSVYFSIFYKNHTGETFTKTLNSYRVEKAKRILSADGEVKPSMIYTDLGFKNQGHFYKVFREHTGHTPLKYREIVKGAEQE